MRDVYNNIELARHAKVVSGNDVMVSVQHDEYVLYTHLIFGMEKSSPTIIEIESENNDFSIVLFGDNIMPISPDTYIIDRRDIYYAVDILQENFQDQNIHISSVCNSIDDAKTIGYILSMLTDSANIVCHWEVSNQNLSYISQILDIIKEESLSSDTGKILFHITVDKAQNYIEIFDILKNLFAKAIGQFDKNTRFDLVFGSDTNPVMYIIIESDKAYIHSRKGDFETDRGIVSPNYEW